MRRTYSLIAFTTLCFTNIFAQTSVPGSGVSDIDGNQYGSVVLGNGQEWMTENLRTTRFNDGTIIPELTQEVDWISAVLPSWCYYDNDAQNFSIHGLLYNGYAVVDERSLCPEGWEVPDTAAWSELVNYVGGELVAGGVLKTTGTIQNQDGLWQAPNTGATNSIGFNGVPSGVRDANDGLFYSLGFTAAYWSSTQATAEGAYNLDMVNSFANTSVNLPSLGRGQSLRCIRSSEVTSSSDMVREDMIVYPNPSNGKYYVNAKGNVRVFDVMGKEVYRTSSFNAPTEIDLSASPSGIYTIQLTNKGGVFTGKVVRE